MNLPNGNAGPIETMLNTMFSPEWLRDTAVRVGLIKRNRKIDPVALFWVLVLGFGVGVQRTLASLRRAYETISAKSIVPSAFYDRFSPQLVAFLKECVSHGIAELASNTSLTLSAKLKGFKDLVVADGTLIKLHKNLARQFPGVRSEAALKIHTVISVTDGGPKSVTLHAGKTAEVKTMRVGPWVRDTILLYDLGYFKYQLFSRIKDVLPHLKREVLDVLVEISLKRRSYKGKASLSKETYRLIGILDQDTNEYHLYLTSLSPEQISAEDVAILYGARWSVELIFK